MALFDHTGDITSDSLTLILDGIPMKEMALNDSRLPVKRIHAGRGRLKVTTRFTESSVTMDLFGKARNLKFNMGESDRGDIFQTVLKEALTGLDELTLSSHIHFENDRLTFTVASNLDRQVSSGLSRLASQSLEEAQREIRRRLNAETGGRFTDVEALLNAFRTDSAKPMDERKNQTDQIDRLIQNKIDSLNSEIEKRKNQEGGKLEKKARSLLNDLMGEKKK